MYVQQIHLSVPRDPPTVAVVFHDGSGLTVWDNAVVLLFVDTMLVAAASLDCGVGLDPEGTVNVSTLDGTYLRSSQFAPTGVMYQKVRWLHRTVAVPTVELQRQAHDMLFHLQVATRMEGRT